MRRAAACLLLCCSTSTIASADPPRIRATARAGEVTVDGHLDEPAWRDAEVGAGFVERTPVPGARPPVDTRFRVLFDEGALYLAVECDLMPGERPRGDELSRDSFSIFSDDAVSVKLDVRHDRRNTIGFVVNPAGAQLDYVAVDAGSFRAEFDALWEAATTVGTDAWVAEIRIPMTALGLAPVDGPRVIGLEVTRDHNARRATYDWSPIPPEFGAVSAVHYGELRGVDAVATGRTVSLSPYLLLGYVEDDEGRFPSGTPWQVAGGGDVRTRLAQDVWAELTLLTDFAQVDLDDAVVNLDRFPLFLPEKRPFFLSGLDVFELGSSGEAQLFFSRRIGLDEAGEEVPMIGGIKVYGRTGPLSLGLLDVVTGDPTTSFTVARARTNLGETSYAGVMATLEHGRGRDRPDYAVGYDLVARMLDERLVLSAYWAGATTERREDDEDAEGGGGAVRREVGQASFAQLRYRGEQLRPRIALLRVTEGFDPSVGFVRRRDLARTEGALEWQRRPGGRLGLDSATVTASARLLRSDDFEDPLGRSADARVDLDFRSGVTAVAAAGVVEDRVGERFELLPGVDVDAGVYRGGTARVGIGRGSSRNPSGGLTYRASTAFFGGALHAIDAELSIVGGPHFRLSTSGTLSFLDLPGHDRVRTTTWSTALTVAPSTRLFFDLVQQLDDVSDTSRWLLRTRWTFRPGGDAFLVYRALHRFGALEEGDPRVEHRVVLKVSYRLDVQ